MRNFTSKSAYFILFCCTTLVKITTAQSTNGGGGGGECDKTWICPHIQDLNISAPILDANFDKDWKDVDAYTTDLVMISGRDYEYGSVSYKCVYDNQHIYFALEIPGPYRFASSSFQRTPAIATMFQIGSKATYVNMGGCPSAMTPGSCEGTSIYDDNNNNDDTCAEYRVDIGSHWELSWTNQSTLYSPPGLHPDVTPGNDPIANQDDEYAVSPYCRYDDNDSKGGNEWSGAWSHTNPVDGELGVYHFELSRSLQTPSTLTDAQLSPGDTAQFGVAFWDPWETDDGWTFIGHYVTGCAQHWIDLELASSFITEQPDERPSSSVIAEPITIFKAIALMVGMHVICTLVY